MIPKSINQIKLVFQIFNSSNLQNIVPRKLIFRKKYF